MKYAHIQRDSYDARDPQISNERVEALKDAMAFCLTLAGGLTAQASSGALIMSLRRIEAHLQAGIEELDPYRRP